MISLITIYNKAPKAYPNAPVKNNLLKENKVPNNAPKIVDDPSR